MRQAGAPHLEEMWASATNRRLPAVNENALYYCRSWNHRQRSLGVKTHWRKNCPERPAGRSSGHMRTTSCRFVLMVLALGCSVLAATLGFFTKTPSHIVGGIAILPPLIAFVAQNLKCEAKNSFHARRVDGLKGLRSRLLYRIPEPPTFDQVAKIAKDRDELEVKMQTEWDNTLLLKWSGVFSHRGSKQLSSGSSATQGLD